MQKDHSIRHPTPDDLLAVLKVRRAAALVDFGATSIDAQALQKSWAPEKLALDSDAWLVEDETGAVVAYAEAPPENETAWINLWVLPQWRGQGIEAQLLALAEERVLVQARAVTIYARSGGPDFAGQAAYEVARYSRYLTFQIMQIDLAEPPPAPQWPVGISGRAFRPGEDDQATYVADEESGADKGYHNPLSFEAWGERMGLYGPRFEPELWLLAWSGTELCGVALCYADAAGAGWVDHLGVRRAWRKQGLGRALLLHSFSLFYARGIRRVKLSVDSGSLTNAPQLYSQAGMSVVQYYHIYSKALHAPQ